MPPTRKFNGSTDSATNSQRLDTMLGLNTGTFMCWMKATGTPDNKANTYGLPALFSDNQGYAALSVGRISSGTDSIWAYGWDGGEKAVGFPLVREKWIHVGWVHDGSFVYLYVDGVKVGSVACVTLSQGGGIWQIGLPYTGVSWFNGWISEVQTWTLGLSDAQFKYAMRNPGALNQSMTGYYKMNQGQGTGFDYSNNARHLTFSGTVPSMEAPVLVKPKRRITLPPVSTVTVSPSALTLTLTLETHAKSILVLPNNISLTLNLETSIRTVSNLPNNQSLTLTEETVSLKNLKPVNEQTVTLTEQTSVPTNLRDTGVQALNTTLEGSAILGTATPGSQDLNLTEENIVPKNSKSTNEQSLNLNLENTSPATSFSANEQSLSLSLQTILVKIAKNLNALDLTLELEEVSIPGTTRFDADEISLSLVLQSVIPKITKVVHEFNENLTLENSTATNQFSIGSLNVVLSLENIIPKLSASVSNLNLTLNEEAISKVISALPHNIPLTITLHAPTTNTSGEVVAESATEVFINFKPISNVILKYNFIEEIVIRKKI